LSKSKNSAVIWAASRPVNAYAEAAFDEFQDRGEIADARGDEVLLRIRDSPPGARDIPSR
jgi:hypothetical protein